MYYIWKLNFVGLLSVTNEQREKLEGKKKNPQNICSTPPPPPFSTDFINCIKAIIADN